MLLVPFVKSKEIISFVGMCKNYNCRPSVLMGLADVYTSYCFDEACYFIMMKLENGEEPQFKREYKSFKELYDSL